MSSATPTPSTISSAQPGAGTGAERPLPYSVAARELLRNTLLDAAGHHLQDHRWVEITMADIALAAGVSRQTLYKEFGSREDFAQVLVMREAGRFLDAVEQAVGGHLDDPALALAAAFDVFLGAAAENPIVRTIVGGEGAEELLALFTTQGKPLVESAVERITQIMLASWPTMVEASEAELLSECLVRLAISYAALPKGPASMTASSVSTLLGPYIEQLVARSL
jgi:AcrR family transcriptional regulator